MQQHLRNESCQEVLVQTPGEAEAGPVVAILEDLQRVALEIHLAIEIFLEEHPHRDLALATVLGPIVLVVEVQVVLHRTARVLGLFILAGRDRRRSGPKRHQNGNGGKNGKEDGGVKATPDLASQVPWHNDQQTEQQGIREAVIARSICRERSVFDRRVLLKNSMVT